MRAISFRMFVGGTALAASIGSAGASPSGLTLQNLVPTSREAPSEYGVDSYGVTTLPAVGTRRRAGIDQRAGPSMAQRDRPPR